MLGMMGPTRGAVGSVAHCEGLFGWELSAVEGSAFGLRERLRPAGARAAPSLRGARARAVRRGALPRDATYLRSRPRYACAWAPMTLSTRITGGCSKCFFTAHWSAARTTASTYLAGNVSGSSMVTCTCVTRPV